MIGYRRGYFLQQLEDMTLPSVITFQATPMFPSISSGSNSTFHFDKNGDNVALCDKLGRTTLGDGMKTVSLKYGVDFAVFEDKKLVDKSKLTIDLNNGNVIYAPLPFQKSGSVTEVPNHYNHTIFKNSAVNFISDEVQVGMAIKNLTTSVTGTITVVAVHTLVTSIDWDVSDEYMITGSKSQPPTAGKVLTCDYYSRIKSINPYSDPYYPTESIVASLPTIYSISILPARKLGRSFSNL